MKKRISIFICLMVIMGMRVYAADFETAADAVRNMGVGWNLGNTLDANNQTVSDVTSASYWGQQGLSSETCWGQEKADQALLKMMKEAGFGAIRVPVTWYNHMDSSGKVDAAWMQRVQEVVDYVINQGMYCIINVHHDTGCDSGNTQGKITGAHWIHASETNYANNQEKYEGLWRQIAETFRDYDQRLLFEAYNEMLDTVYTKSYENGKFSGFTWGSWCFASFNAPGQYNAAKAASAYKAINSYAQSFVNAVRATGGNNAQRNLVINTYGACCGSGTWNNHLKDPLSQLTMPTDPAGTAVNHLIVQVHDYPNVENGMANVKAEIDDMMAAWNTYFLSKGIPMILGEWGTANVDKGDGKTDYDLRRDAVFEFVDYMIKKCKEKNVATFYWMGLTDGAYRTLPAFSQPDLAERIVKAYHGSDFTGIFPTADGFDIQYIVNYESNWAELFLYGNYNSLNPFKLSEYKGLRLEMDDSYGNKLQVKVYGDANGKNTDGSTKYKEGYYLLSSTSKTTTVNFESARTGSTVSRITLQTNVGATKAKVVKAVLLKSDNSEVALTPTVAWGCTLDTESTPVSGIESVHYRHHADGVMYNLHGQRISKPSKGIYIKNGKKYYPE